MTHQATANGFRCTVYLVFRAFKLALWRVFCFVTDGQTDTMWENNDHVFGRGLNHIYRQTLVKIVITAGLALMMIIFARCLYDIHETSHLHLFQLFQMFSSEKWIVLVGVEGSIKCWQVVDALVGRKVGLAALFALVIGLSDLGHDTRHADVDCWCNQFFTLEAKRL